MKYRVMNYLNVRKEPNLNSEISHTLPPYTIVYGHKVGEGWVETCEGFLYAGYLEPYPDIETILPQFAQKYDVELPILRSVLQIESAGSGFTQKGIKIRNELHLFAQSDDSYKNYIRFDVTKKWVGHELFDDVWFNPHLNQSNEYRAFTVLSRKNKKAAYSSISVGIGQVMIGYHFGKMGFGTVYDAFDYMSISPDVDLFSWLRFLVNFGDSLKFLKEKNWLSFARLYNGTGQAQHYANLLQKQYEKERNNGR